MAALSSQAKECIDWIQQVLSSSESYHLSCSTELELLETLSDGDILCNLLAEVSDGQVSIEGSVYFSSHSHVIAKRSLEFFLRQCQEVFNMAPEQLFDPDDLLTQTNPERVVRALLNLQSVVKAKNSLRGGDQRVKPSHMETSGVVKEICDHEKALADKLELLLKYRKELLGMLSVWSPELVGVVFQYTERLYSLHMDFWARFTALAGKGHAEFCHQLGALFDDIEPRLQIYMEFYAHLPIANAMLEAEFKKNPRLAEQLKMIEGHFKGLSFRGLYDGPIRQLTNYFQLFKRLRDSAAIELTAECAKSVERVAQRMEALLLSLNTFKQQAEQLAATKVVLALVGDLPSELQNPSDTGMLLADEFLKVRKGLKAEPQLCLCVLTQKQLIVAKKAAKIKEVVGDAQTTYWFHAPISSALQVSNSDKKMDSLEVVLAGSETIQLKSHKCPVTEKWAGHLKEARGTIYPDGWNTKGHSFELKSLPQDSPCSRCCKPLPGLVMQGYSCSHCSKQLHLQCFRQYIQLTADDFYHRNLDRIATEDLLENCSVGTFLIRDSSTPGVKAFSIRTPNITGRTGKMVDHFTINDTPGQCSIGKAKVSCKNLDELIDHYRVTPMSRDFTTIGCVLGDGVEVRSVTAGQGARPLERKSQS